jgi:excisionase family DNA binding protein
LLFIWRTPWRLQIGKPVAYSGAMSERDPKIPDLVSKAQAAEILGVTHQAVQQMVDKGRLKGAKVGSTWVFRRVVVADFVDREKLLARYGSCPACGVTRGEFPEGRCTDPDGWHERTYPE